MSHRRAANNRIRGPQSALTDFLASNNISAAQISADYERRRNEAQQQAEQAPTTDDNPPAQINQPTTALEKKKRKQQEEKVLATIKGNKGSKRRKKGDDEETDENDENLAWNMYTKKVPLPGQLENCETCDKRFTVTPYSKTGPDGGLLCTKCSKEQEAQKKKDQKLKKPAISREKRRQAQSNLLDGITQHGSRSLQDLCIKTVADNIHEIDEFGDLPPLLLNRLSQILSKRRVINSRTLNLFLRPEFDSIDIYDCAKLEVADYIKLFSIVPNVQKLNLVNASQIKDEVIDYILERNVPLRELKLEAANLVSNQKWEKLFTKLGHRLETLKLSWLDYSMDDNTFLHLVHGCPNLNRLKIVKCFRLSDVSLGYISDLKHLEHLSLRFSTVITSKTLTNLIAAIGLNLRTLSLKGFEEADDEVLTNIHDHCSNLNKLRFTENCSCSDNGYTALFTNWANPPLSYVDFSSNRSIDCDQPDGPDEPIGLASAGFSALINHSGKQLEHLDISSCRHIAYQTLSDLFDGKRQYPNLRNINISFLTKVDTAIVAGLFKSCPQLTKVIAFGCFNVTDVAVPRGVVLIGVPNAQDSIVQGDVNVNVWNTALLAEMIDT